MSPDRCAQLNDKIPRDLETVCLKCLQKEPKKRYASAQALADDLRRFIQGQPIRARPTPFWEKGWKWARRHSAVAAALAFAVFALLAGSALSVWQAFMASAEAARASKAEAAALDRAARATGPRGRTHGQGQGGPECRRCTQGMVKLFQERLEIKIENPKQVEIVEKN